MPDTTRIVSPGPKPRTVRCSESNKVLFVPDDWALLPPGDASITRKVKAGGPTWTVQVKKGRRTMSRGVWAPKTRIERAKRSVAVKRASPDHQRKLAQSRARRERDQRAYVRAFEASVRAFLNFDARYQLIEFQLARAVTAHATPVGSGTVARTKRIPVEERAEAAVIAWMRHQTTAYDNLQIPRRKGARRAVRRMLAGRSRALLEAYRRGKPVDVATCPLAQALESLRLANAASSA